MRSIALAVGVIHFDDVVIRALHRFAKYLIHCYCSIVAAIQCASQVSSDGAHAVPPKDHQNLLTSSTLIALVWAVTRLVMADEKMGVSIPLCPKNARLFARNAISTGIHGVGRQEVP